MKRAIVCILVFVLVFSINPFVYAEESSGYDFSGWTDDQMLYLFSQVEAELDRRGLMKSVESSTELSSKTTQALSVTASELFKAFEENEISANKSYKGQAVEVLGRIETLYSFGNIYVVVLRETGFDSFASIQCYFDNKHEDDLAKLKIGDIVTFRGTCKGFSLMMVSMDNCEVVNIQ